MNRYLLFLLLVASLAYCISSETVLKENDVLLDSITGSHFYLNFYPDVNKKIREKISRFLDFGLEDFQTNSSNCSLELLQFWGDLDNEEQAAYLDSYGKVGAGILTGNVRYLGYYDQCIDIGNTDYCRFPFNVILTTNTTISSNGPVTIRVPFEFGMCFPSSCDAKDFYNLFFIGSDEVFSYSESFTDVDAMTYTMNVMAPIEYTEPLCPWRDLEWTDSSIIVLTVCVLLITLVITGTVTDISFWFINDIFPKLHLCQKGLQESTSCEVNEHSINEDEPLINAKPKPKASQSMTEKRCIEFVKDFVLSFSLYKTVPAIMATHQPAANAITSINGIRVISMFWVILGHTLVFEMAYGVVANIQELVEEVPNRFLFQAVDNASFAVDSFFILSGLLVSYLSIREMERCQGKFPFISFYLHRLLRLSPAYYLVMFIYFKVLPYVGSGPLWIFIDSYHCEKYWWTNILYINNFYPTLPFDQCYAITWYLANDMQFFIISPIFLLLLYQFWKMGLATIVGTMLASIAIIGTLAGITNANANLIQGILVSRFAVTNLYEKPYCRINAYMIGIVLGFVLYKKWRVKPKFNLWLHICFYSALWMIAATSCLTIVFGQYKTWNGHPFTKAENVMYFMFSRTVYSIGIALMIYACHNGFGGIINKCLSWSFWIPLSRLTFMAYLSHPIVLTLMYATMRFRFFYTDWLLIVLFAAAVVLSYSLALILAVTVEYPLANVENAVYKFIGMKRRN